MSEAITTIKKQSWNRHKKPSGYGTSNILLLYRMADLGMLETMRGVYKLEDGTKRYYFERTDEVKSAFDKFKEEYPDEKI